MRTLGNKIIVKPCEGDNVSEGGIIVPDSFKERPSKGIVVAAGSKTYLKEGYTVWHVKGAGAEIEGGLFVMADSDIHGYSEN